jgi:hypothetical protein
VTRSQIAGEVVALIGRSMKEAKLDLMAKLDTEARL